MVTPTQVGMNRRMCIRMTYRGSNPHASGDEPVAESFRQELLNVTPTQVGMHLSLGVRSGFQKSYPHMFMGLGRGVQII